jgi:outer membrane immunogenic protein
MRLILLAAMMCGVAAGAPAADLPDLPILRGAVTDGGIYSTRNWDGWYAGGQVDYTSADMDFSHSVKTLTNFMERAEWEYVRFMSVKDTSFSTNHVGAGLGYKF